MKPNLSILFTPTPLWLDLFFAATTLITLVMLYMAVRRVSVAGATRVLVISIVWLTLLAILASNHFFQQLDTFPPHFILALGPPFVLIIVLLSTTQGRHWIEPLPLSVLTTLHTVRVPVELTLYALYIHQQVPELMTFEGGNYDILSGLSAPVVAYFAFRKQQLSPRWLLVWNILALGLVINIVVRAVLSAPLPFQQLAFDQPNVGILKFPYIWLPGFIVPVVLFSHGVAIIRLLRNQTATVV
ncbi:hypothetical protein [Spirosoma pollinicola]|uniref:Uncharacterized protein n=1 Tax=Spirosoma pollinicola TaxID=2057025 RepID=A0A2K8Z0G4_9BACT|nr:hypothetical protein [Spirosoma pollinicola]AUD03314.1 hypothetical protein CWM47_16615 [Spirosoma pollinicola]